MSALPKSPIEVEPLDFVEPAKADRRLAQLPPPLPRASSDASEREAPVSAGVPLHELGVGDLIHAFRDGGTTPSALCRALVERIEHHPSGRDAVLALLAFEEAAEESGRRYAAGIPRSLEGVPFGVKAIIDVAGSLVTCGSHLTGERIAPADAAVVAMLRRAGAIPFAMLATSEFACGGPDNPRHGRVANPHDRSRWTGGSSTGSGAAVAARLVPFALGTDTGGSIRVPSAWCGITGLKPTRGRVSRIGVSTLSFTLDHVGPMARSAADLALCLSAMTGAPAAPPLVASVAGLRIGIADGWFAAKVSAEVASAFEAALSRLVAAGADLVPVAVPAAMERWHRIAWDVLCAEAASVYAPFLSDRRDEMDEVLVDRLERGLSLSARDYIDALCTRAEAQEAMLAAMACIDLLATPGLGTTAARLDTRTADLDGVPVPFRDIISRNTMIFDYTGFPALMLPTGRGRDGLPLSMQIVGRPGADELSLAAGAVFQALDVSHRIAPPEPAA